MNRYARLMIPIVVGFVIMTGCYSPIAYKTPAPQLNEQGPTILVCSVRDSRGDRRGEDVTREVQHLIVAELTGMGCFKWVLAASNSTPVSADYRLEPELHLLEAGMPSVFTGRRDFKMTSVLEGPASARANSGAMTLTHGYAAMSFKLLAKADPVPLTLFYPDVIATNRSSVASADPAHAESAMLASAVELTLSQLKADLRKVLAERSKSGGAGDR